MIELQTGLPGACKTLYTLDRIEALRLKTRRPVFYVARDQADDLAPGIVELTLPWSVIKVEDWPSCPPDSIVVIDECQKVPGFRPRPTNSPAPAWAEPAMETHRGKGIDLVLICQHPSQLHVGIRRLVGRHLHAVRKFGLPVSTVHEWGSTKDQCDKSRADSIQHLYKFNPKAYKYYKSAEVHTHKVSIPKKVWALVGIVLLVPALAWYGFNQAGSLGKVQSDMAASGQVGTTGGGGVVGGGGGRGGAPMTPAQYAEAHQARIHGLPHTAPIYDDVTRPAHAPYPAACLQMGKRCQCYTQQATRLDTPAELCRQIADGGFFVAWDQPVSRGVPLEPPRGSVSMSEPVPAAPGGGAGASVSLTRL